MVGFAQRHVQRQAGQVVGYRVQRRVLLQEQNFQIALTGVAGFRAHAGRAVFQLMVVNLAQSD